MRYGRVGDQVTYECRRRWPGPLGATSRISVREGDAVTAGPLEQFVTARWALHQADHRGRARYWPIHHVRWPLFSAAVRQFDDELLAAAGFADLAARPPDSVLFSPGVRATFGPRVRAHHSGGHVAV